MRSGVRSGFGLSAVIAISAWMFVVAQAFGQDGQSCRRVEGDGASYLEQCGDRLRSFTLSLQDIRRSVGSDLHARFRFGCPIEPMCENEPEIFGWFIDQHQWRGGTQGEAAIFDLLERQPLGATVWTTFTGARVEPPVPVCEMFAVTISDMAGRAVCYRFPAIPQSAIVIVASDENTGFVLIFSARTLNWESLRAKTLQRLPRFEIHRASGDAALLRWMRGPPEKRPYLEWTR